MRPQEISKFLVGQPQGLRPPNLRSTAAFLQHFICASVRANDMYIQKTFATKRLIECPSFSMCFHMHANDVCVRIAINIQKALPLRGMEYAVICIFIFNIQYLPLSTCTKRAGGMVRSTWNSCLGSIWWLQSPFLDVQGGFGRILGRFWRYFERNLKEFRWDLEGFGEIFWYDRTYRPPRFFFLYYVFFVSFSFVFVLFFVFFGVWFAWKPKQKH